MAMHFISLADLPGWLGKLAATRSVYAPTLEGTAVVYRPFAEGQAIELALRPTESAKHIIFPRSEELFTFERQLKNDKQGGRVLSLHEAADPGPMVIFGAPSCDARGFFAFDPVYDGAGTKGQAKDTYYLKRRTQTTIIAKACQTVLNTCFCNWVNGSPHCPDGADVLATQLADGFVLDALTDKGREVVAGLAEATADHKKAVEAAHAASDALLPKAPDISKAPEAILGRFDDAEFWQEQSAQCLSCGACTYLCPTCYCFNITDESNGINGVRLRSWDSCMASLFTLEASGHNPRNGKAARLKNRVGHKFSYYPKLRQGHFSCVGCGRCIKSCPSSVDIRQIVLNALNAKPKKEAANG